jgi:hypothetical protein
MRMTYGNGRGAEGGKKQLFILRPVTFLLIRGWVVQSRGRKKTFTTGLKNLSDS